MFLLLCCLAASLHSDHERALQPGRRLHRCVWVHVQRGGFPLTGCSCAGILEWIFGKRDGIWMSFLTRSVLENANRYSIESCSWRGLSFRLGCNSFQTVHCNGERKPKLIRDHWLVDDFKGICRFIFVVQMTSWPQPDKLRPTVNLSASTPQLRGSQNAPGSDQDAGAGLFHPGGEPNRPGLHHHQVQAAQHWRLRVSAAALKP